MSLKDIIDFIDRGLKEDVLARILAIIVTIFIIF